MWRNTRPDPRICAALLFTLVFAGSPTAQQSQTPAAQGELKSKYLKVRVGPADRTAAPGQRVTLTLDVTPGPKLHVYAPGQTGYIPTTLKLKPSTDFKVLPGKYPASETYFYAPTNETVKVCSKPFQIAQDITLAATAALRKRAVAKETIEIGGTLEYQACDDLVCYRPDSLPVSWKITLAAER